MVARVRVVATVLALLVVHHDAVRAADPASAVSTAVVAVKRSDAVFYGSSSDDTDWGAPLPPEKMHRSDKRSFYRLYYNTGVFTDRFGCTARETLAAQQGSANFSLPAAPFILLVDRGRCDYSEKAYHAQTLGASALIITDTLEQVENRTLTALRDDTLSGAKRAEALGMEYSCANGKAQAWDKISVDTLLNFTAPGWSSLPNVSKCTDNSFCESDMCVPTGVGREVCCVWDIPDTMGFGSFIEDGDRDNITITVIRLKIADGNALKALVAEEPESLLTYYERDPPTVDPASFIIWFLAVVTVMTGGYKGAQYERTKAQLKAALVTTDVTSSEETAQARVAYQEHEELAAMEEVMDLTIYHAFGFLILGSAFLLLLFYVDIVLVLVVGFAIGAVSCTFQELWGPLFNRLKCLRMQPFQNCSYQSAYLSPALWTIGDLLAIVFAIGVSLLWFLTRHHNYSWVFQDIFGICFCMVFLKTVRLPNLKIATVLLVLVFFYDIFMVFISPLIFKESVMIKAATGGSQAAATVSSGYCLRYPSDSKTGCLKENMPILLRMPKVLDWREGYAMLGLGDIVLPGLLVVFCARYDYATRGQLYGKVKPQHGRHKSFRAMDVNSSAELGEPASMTAAACSRRGLFGAIIWGYAFGLFFANLGVVLMQKGQPALMYLVPTTLGLLCIIAWRRGILGKLWDGPPELQPGYQNGVVLERARSPSTHHSMLSLEQGLHGNGMVLMMDSTPVSGSYARSETTPSETQRDTTNTSEKP
uniref:PA domain-containing protein n=1 Tax=Globisporangium ultimum (strain ATCC 200006 / CBS 805.95 / DAOM BR144) TaxID=431595 RepID=K3W607_GLOUD